MNVILFGKSLCSEIKLRILRRDHPELSRWTLNPMTRLLITDTRKATHRGEGHLTTAADIRVSSHKPRNASLYQKLEKARTKSPLEPLEGA